MPCTIIGGVNEFLTFFSHLRYGVVFHGIHDNRLEVTFKREMRRYKLLHSLEFDPTRKRMSVIIQNEKGSKSSTNYRFR